MVSEAARSLALWSAVVGLAAIVALVLMYAGLAFFGPVNDVLGAVTVGFVLLLAIAARDLLPGNVALRWALLAFAVAGALVAVIGAVLVLTGRTGWYLAGLWSVLGWGLVGIWFATLALTLVGNAAWPTWLRIIGVLAGVLLVVGLGVLPGIVAGTDDWNAATPLLVVVQSAGALGSLLLLLWCLGVGRSAV